VEELHHLTALYNAIFSTATVQLFSFQFSWWSQMYHTKVLLQTFQTYNIQGSSHFDCNWLPWSLHTI